MAITGADVERFLVLFADRIHAARDELTALDSAIGDADHGINMDRGMTAVREVLPSLRDGDLGTMLKQTGMKLISTVGGASGPLYGTFFLRMGTALGEAHEASPQQLADAVAAGLEGVVMRGKAELDDKTMVDAMTPATAALREGAATSWKEALSTGAQRAAEGRDRITPLVARKGRASYLGERSANHQDPGATSTTILFESLRDAMSPES
ncbi:MAG TPA: dihydroxyacetone kinase subunit DhaL [Candidatus Limnocylindrales bacterium]|nr:dihydroxyacetone kinase subunit DhaL [Candidatus Limnocylindrales bacterium]